jgi:hypothetical protein
MVDDGIYTTNAQIQARAGTNANATAKSAAETDKYVLSVEALVNSLTRYNWSDAVTAGLNADVQGILTEASACLCAVYVVAQDMSGYSSRIEAEDLINVLRDRALFAIAILRDKKVQDFINGA